MGSTLDPGSRSEFLSSPASIQRSESEYSHAYLLLDFYEIDTLDLQSDQTRKADTSWVLLESPQQDTPGIEGFTTPSEVSVPESNETRSTIKDGKWRKPKIVGLTEIKVRDLLDSNYDLYGFRKDLGYFDALRDSFNEWFGQYLAHILHQKKRWRLLMKQHGLDIRENSEPTRFPPKLDKVKKLVRKGIPPEWRGNAWFFYAGGHDMLNKHVGLYEKLVQDTVGLVNKDVDVIERDLNRTFPDNRYFNNNIDSESFRLLETPPPPPDAIKALRRVLVAFSCYLPLIGYCQSLNFLAGLLLLFMDEEKAFWMLVILTERIVPRVHSKDLEGVHTDQGVLMMCIKEYIPRMWGIIGKSPDGSILPDDKILTRLPPVTLVTSPWFMSLFVNVLPTESVLRIWDILWYEGSKTIFRFSLTICRTCLDSPTLAAKDAKHNAGDEIEMFEFLQNYPRSLTNPNLLVDNCFKKIGGYGYGFLSQDEINRCRAFVSQQRNKLRKKANGFLGAELSALERQALSPSIPNDGEIHDIYGFQRPIMSGVAWNKHISTRMRRKFSGKK